MDIVSTKVLNNGVKMPFVGLGVFRSNDEETKSSVEWAIKAGYRHIDTAKIYSNERSTGEGVRASAVARAEIFVTTKLWNADMRAGKQMEAFEKSLKHLNMDYVDLYLIHWPVENFIQSWKIMEEIYQSGRAKAIGVSNFMQHHLDALLKEAKIVPAVNQIECHPYLSCEGLIEYCDDKGIAPEAYSPLGGDGANVLKDQVIVKIAANHGKTAAQVVLRWNLQRGVIVIPKSVRKERVEENAKLYDFELSATEMKEISALNKNQRFGADPDNFDF